MRRCLCVPYGEVNDSPKARRLRTVVMTLSSAVGMDRFGTLATNLTSDLVPPYALCARRRRVGPTAAWRENAQECTYHRRSPDRSSIPSKRRTAPVPQA